VLRRLASKWIPEIANAAEAAINAGISEGTSG